MAIALASQANIFSGGTSTNAAAMTAPTGLGTSDLDLVFLGLANDWGTRSTASLGTDSGSYTATFNQNADNSGQIQAAILVGRKLGAASPGTTTPTWTGEARLYAGTRTRWSGVDLTTPVPVVGSLVEATVTASTSSGTTLLTVPAETTPVANCVAVVPFVMSGRTDDNPIALNASGWTKVIAGNANWSSSTVTSGLFYKLIASAGTTGTCAITASTATEGTDQSAIGGMLILQPAGGGGGGGTVRPRAIMIL